MAQPPNNLQYRKMMLLDHNPKDVAWLIHKSAPSLFALMFGSKAIPVLTALVQRSHNRFSHRHIWVAEANGQILGIAIALPAVELHNQADYSAVLSTGQQLRLRLAQQLLLNRLLQHDYPSDTLYIANLAVHPEYRGGGIGTQLLLRCFDEATTLAVNSVFISVDVHNLRAQKLYESLGFQVKDAKTLNLFGKIVGSRILSRSLTDH